MGIVYRALDPSIGRIVAIKSIKLSDVADEDERRRLTEPLIREATSAGRLSHPHIVTIFDISHEGDVAYIAMEFVDGPSLDRHMRTQPLEGADVLRILRQAAEGLDFAHRNGVVHRDIKPSNLLLQQGQHVKIADFGVAKIQSHQLTLSGTLIGTPNYMSPEQIQGQPVTGKADQFSLAVIAYELLTGEKPFTAESMPTLVFKIVREEPVAPQRINPSLAWPVEKVLGRAIAKNPDDRFNSCAEFVIALENSLKASKGWQPMAPGAAAVLPTVTGREIAAPSASPDNRSAFPDIQILPPERPSAFLRVARAVATVVFVGGLAGYAGLIGYQTWFEQPVEVEPPPLKKEDRPPTPSSAAPPAENERAEVREPVKEEPKPSVPRREERKQDRKEEKTAAIPKAARVVTSPPGAGLYVDGQSTLFCRTPCELNLPRGRHTFIARLDGYRPEQRILQVPGDEGVFISLQKTTGTLMVRSDPPGSSIVLDGQTREEKTPAMMTVPTGHHQVEVRRDGYRSTSQTVEVKDSTLTNVDLKLAGNQ